MSVLGRWTGMTTGDYQGGHDFHHCVVESDLKRTRYSLSDVPNFVRIDHPDRKPFRAAGGEKKRKPVQGQGQGGNE